MPAGKKPGDTGENARMLYYKFLTMQADILYGIETPKYIDEDGKEKPKNQEWLLKQVGRSKHWLSLVRRKEWSTHIEDRVMARAYRTPLSTIRAALIRKIQAGDMKAIEIALKLDKFYTEKVDVSIRATASDFFTKEAVSAKIVQDEPESI